jgi:hypothetical protein
MITSFLYPDHSENTFIATNSNRQQHLHSDKTHHKACYKAQILG